MDVCHPLRHPCSLGPAAINGCRRVSLRYRERQPFHVLIYYRRLCGVLPINVEPTQSGTGSSASGEARGRTAPCGNQEGAAKWGVITAKKGVIMGAKWGS